MLKFYCNLNMTPKRFFRTEKSLILHRLAILPLRLNLNTVINKLTRGSTFLKSSTKLHIYKHRNKYKKLKYILLKNFKYKK